MCLKNKMKKNSISFLYVLLLSSSWGQSDGIKQLDEKLIRNLPFLDQKYFIFIFVVSFPLNTNLFIFLCVYMNVRVEGVLRMIHIKIKSEVPFYARDFLGNFFWNFSSCFMDFYNNFKKILIFIYFLTNFLNNPYNYPFILLSLPFVTTFLIFCIRFQPSLTLTFFFFLCSTQFFIFIFMMMPSLHGSWFLLHLIIHPFVFIYFYLSFGQWKELWKSTHYIFFC